MTTETNPYGVYFNCQQLSSPDRFIEIHRLLKVHGSYYDALTHQVLTKPDIITTDFNQKDVYQLFKQAAITKLEYEKQSGFAKTIIIDPSTNQTADLMETLHKLHEHLLARRLLFDISILTGAALLLAASDILSITLGGLWSSLSICAWLIIPILCLVLLFGRKNTYIFMAMRIAPHSFIKNTQHRPFKASPMRKALLEMAFWQPIIKSLDRKVENLQHQFDTMNYQQYKKALSYWLKQSEDRQYALRSDFMQYVNLFNKD